MATTSLVRKVPNAVLDYGFDWSQWLQTGESIVTSSWVSSDPAITIDSNYITNGTVTVVWLSGGVASKKYFLTNTITTDAAIARTDERTLTVSVVAKKS